MSLFGGLECVFAVGCVRWLWKRCTYIGAYDSATWPTAEADDFAAVPRLCRTILAIYEEDIKNPKLRPASEYGLNPECVIKRADYKRTLGQCPPYLIYVDHENREIVVAIRGLNLAKQTDYKVLLDNRLGKQMFDGGYVHYGLLKSAIWLLTQESETLRKLWVENGSEYTMVFVGHSLGSGVAALMTIIAVNHRDLLGGIPRSKIRCYSLAPARSMSLNLAVKYADVIHSVVLQARLVANGYSQKLWIDYTEVYAPVTRMDTVRMITAMVAQNGWKLNQLDVDSVFLHGALREDVYAEQPKGYMIKGSEHKVYMLHKALYGLKQASRAWLSHVETFINSGFKRSQHEQTLFMMNKTGDTDRRRSTSCYTFMMSGGVVAWSSKKQAVVALSITKAEYIATTTCLSANLHEKSFAREGVCIRGQCDNYYVGQQLSYYVGKKSSLSHEKQAHGCMLSLPARSHK